LVIFGIECEDFHQQKHGPQSDERTFLGL